MFYNTPYYPMTFCMSIRILIMKKKKWKNYQTFTTKNWL